MSNEERNIKDYDLQLGIFILINGIIYLLFSFGSVFVLNFLNDAYIVLLIDSGIFVAILVLIAFVADGLLSSNFKAQIVFRKRKNPYPGCYIFTNLTDDDLRIDKSKLIDKYGELPTDPIAQNRLWYNIFENYQYVTKILESHRAFLLFRDLTGLSFVILFIAPATALISYLIFHVAFNLFWWYMLLLVVQYIILSKISQDRGNRFANNVLALESNSISK